MASSFWQSAAGRYTRRALLTAPMLLAFLDTVADGAVVHGTAMQAGTGAGHRWQPTLNPAGGQSRDIVLLDRSVVRSYDVRRGDVVALWSPDQPRVAMIRRLVGVEGDVVLSRKSEWVLIPRGHVWVEGDNADASSHDSQHYGPIPMGLIFARVPAVLWPPNRAGRVPPAKPQARVQPANADATLLGLGIR